MNQYYCTNGGRDCQVCPPCGHPPHPPHPPQPPQPRCLCSAAFRALLDLLCNPQIAGLVNQSAFGFIGSSYLLGTATTADPPLQTAPGDNLTVPTGVFTCGTGHDTVSASGPLAAAEAASTPITIGITQAVLCGMAAIVFDAAGTEAAQAANFQTISQFLSQALRSGSDFCPCSDSGATTLLRSAAARTVTLTAGPLILRGVTVLGELGDVLVLANSTVNRFYLVCAEAVEFFG